MQKHFHVPYVVIARLWPHNSACGDRSLTAANLIPYCNRSFGSALRYGWETKIPKNYHVPQKRRKIDSATYYDYFQWGPPAPGVIEIPLGALGLKHTLRREFFENSICFFGPEVSTIFEFFIFRFLPSKSNRQIQPFHAGCLT